MCGIVGYVCNKKHAAKAFELFTRLMEESQVRGKHASGIAWVERERLWVHKEPVPSRTLVRTAWWQGVKAHAPTAIVGHCRYSTSGDWAANTNNQPLASARLALVHNGLVSMAERGRVEQQYKVRLRTANDSEVLLRRVEKAQGDVAKALEAVYRVEAPIFALGLLDAGGGLRVVRDHLRPLWLFRIEALGLTGFASTKDIVDRALKGLGLRYKAWAAEPYVVYGLAPKGAAALQHLPRAVPSEPRWKRPAVQHPMMAAARPPANLEYDKGRQFDHRLNLRKSFKQYCVAAIASEEIDPAYSMMTYLFERYELSLEQRLWICYLYGVFYHVGSVFLILQEFPDFAKVDLGRLTRWHTKHWRTLCYNSDRKWERGHLPEMVASYIEVIGSQAPDAQQKFFAGLLTANGDRVVNFHSVTTALRNLVRFGRYSCYIYTEALMRCVGLPLEADTIFLKEADSPRHGLCIVLGKPGWAKGTLTKDQWAWLEAGADKLLREIQSSYPKLLMDHFYFESTLCSWKGYWRPKKGRYLGFYHDRVINEIEKTRATPVAVGVDWDVLYQFRRETIIPEYLGELAEPPRTGVYKPWEHVLRDTGRMVGLWPIVQRGLLVK